MKPLLTATTGGKSSETTPFSRLWQQPCRVIAVELRPLTVQTLIRGRKKAELHKRCISFGSSAIFDEDPWLSAPSSRRVRLYRKLYSLFIQMLQHITGSFPRQMRQHYFLLINK
jgi:hypothetical protein